MLKLFYKLFPKTFNKLVYEGYAKPKDFTNLVFHFVDSKGRRYFRYEDDFKMPLKRKGELEDLLIEMSASLTKTEDDEFLKAMEKANNEGDKNMMGYLLVQRRERKKWLVRAEIMWHMAAVVNIREDEINTEFDNEIQREKIETFKTDFKIHDFFVTGGLTKYIPYLQKSEKDWITYIRGREAEAKAMSEQIRLLLSITDKSGASNMQSKPQGQIVN